MEPDSIDSCPEKGYYIKCLPEGAPAAMYSHVLCGPNTMEGADCPNCEKPLVLFLTFDTSDPRLELGECDFARLPLYYCETCHISSRPPGFQYRVNPDASITVLTWGERRLPEGTPYPDYPAAFRACPVVLEELPKEIHEGMKDYYDITTPYADPPIERHSDYRYPHEAGGYPRLPQDFQCIACVGCGAHMPLLARVGDDGPDGTRLHGNVGADVEFYYCRKCSIVSASYQGD